MASDDSKPTDLRPIIAGPSPCSRDGPDPGAYIYWQTRWYGTTLPIKRLPYGTYLTTLQEDPPGQPLQYAAGLRDVKVQVVGNPSPERITLVNNHYTWTYMAGPAVGVDGQRVLVEATRIVPEGCSTDLYPLVCKLYGPQQVVGEKKARRHGCKISRASL